MNILKLAVMAFILSLPCVTDAYGAVYKCIENNGNIKYQSYPCTNQNNDTHRGSSPNINTPKVRTETGSNQNNVIRNVTSGIHKSFKISPFKASYYTEDDGSKPGKGNDGTITSVTPRLQYEESVKRPSINYSYKDFHGIDSYNFYGVWEGIITAISGEQFVNAHFDVSQADVSLYVNDTLIEKWRDDSKIVRFKLNKGENTVRVELHNHWHTTSFNTSFTDYRKYDKTEVVELFNDIDFNSTKTIYLGAYEAGKDIHNEVLVTLPKSPSPVFVFLNSYRAANWVISNPHNIEVVGVGIRGNSPGSTVAGIAPDLVLELPQQRNAYKSSYGVKAFTGKRADYAFTKYSLKDITIPDFFPTVHAPERDSKNSDSAISNSVHPDTVPVNQFIETLLTRQHGKEATETRIVKAPTLSGSFIEATWKGYVEVSETRDKTFTIHYPGVNIELIIDGRSVWKGRGNSSIPIDIREYTFKPGRHEVMFVAHPHWDSRPAELEVAITDNARDMTFDELAARLKELGDFDSIYCGVNNRRTPTLPGDPKRTATHTVGLNLQDSEKPLVLFLASFRQTVWDFTNSNTDNLAAIVTSAKNAGVTIKNLPPHIPVFHFFKLSNTTHIIPVRGRDNIQNTFKSAALQILSLTGNLPTGFSGAEKVDTIKVPEEILDRERYREIGFSNVLPDYNIFIEYPKKIDVVFNPVATKYIDPELSSNRSLISLIQATRPITPEVQRESWAVPLEATKDIPTDAFKAYYFDVFNPGQPKFSGIVENVSIKSVGSKVKRSQTSSTDNYGIIPRNFGAFWIGKISLEEDKELEINIDIGHADTRLLIDNKVIKDRKIVLSKGLHTIEIEFANNWHTYGFSFSMTETQPLLAYEDLKKQVERTLSRQVHTAYVGVYGSKSGDNSINLEIQNVGQPIFLILTSADPVNWIIEGPGAEDVQALLISSMNPRSQIKGSIQQEVPRFYFPMGRNTYQLESKCECQSGYYSCPSEDLFNTIDYVEIITGQNISSFAGNYRSESFVIPETLIDKEQFENLRKSAGESLLIKARCERPELVPQHLKEEQRKQIDEHASVRAALEVMELIRDNKFERYLEFIPSKTKENYFERLKSSFLLMHNGFAGYDASIAYHQIDKELYDDIISNKANLEIPLILERNEFKKINVRVHLNNTGDRWNVLKFK